MKFVLMILSVFLLIGCSSAQIAEYNQGFGADMTKRKLVKYENADLLVNGVFCKQNENEISANICEYASAYFQMQHFYKARNKSKYVDYKDSACKAYLKLTDSDLQVLHKFAIKEKLYDKPLIDDELVKVWQNWCIEN